MAKAPKKPAKKPPGGPKGTDFEVGERVRLARQLYVEGARDREILEKLGQRYGKSERTHRDDLKKARDQLRHEHAKEDSEALAFHQAARLKAYRLTMESLEQARQAAESQGVVLDPRAVAQIVKVGLQALDMHAELAGIRPQDQANLARARQDDAVTEKVSDGCDLVVAMVRQIQGDGGLQAVLGRDLQAEAAPHPGQA
jgi:hypothetical protein